MNLSKRNEGYNTDSVGAKYVPVDEAGVPFKNPEYYIKPSEYRKIISAINTNYESCFKNKRYGYIRTAINKKHYRYATYYFEIHGFNNYNIYDKETE